MVQSVKSLPKALVWRRIHSLTGVWLVLFLIEHLFTNSQAALLWGEDGIGFIRAVNEIRALPYIQGIELFLIGAPILIHMVWGIAYLKNAKYNSFATDGSSPSLLYPRNKAYTWQRVTSWILVVGLIGHVVQMRFFDYPVDAGSAEHKNYMVWLKMDGGLYTLTDRLGVKLYNQQEVDQLAEHLVQEKQKLKVSSVPEGSYNPELAKQIDEEQSFREKEQWVGALKKHPLKEQEVIAVADSFGAASLLAVRETFKNPWFMILYTLFVFAACFHAFNGLWTAMIAWGLTVSVHSQKGMRRISNLLMIFVTFLGLVAIWGTYWINLKH